MFFCLFVCLFVFNRVVSFFFFFFFFFFCMYISARKGVVFCDSTGQFFL